MTQTGEPQTPILQLHAEQATIVRREVPTETVRVTAGTRTREVPLQETLTHTRVSVEHVPVGRYVDAVPEIRQEGEVTIMPVVEEEVVVTRRLFLREEVHVRRVEITSEHNETVTVREQHVEVSRIPTEPSSAG